MIYFDKIDKILVKLCFDLSLSIKFLLMKIGKDFIILVKIMMYKRIFIFVVEQILQKYF